MSYLGGEHDGIVDQESSVQIEQARQCHKFAPAPVLGGLRRSRHALSARCALTPPQPHFTRASTRGIRDNALRMYTSQIYLHFNPSKSRPSPL